MSGPCEYSAVDHAAPRETKPSQKIGSEAMMNRMNQSAPYRCSPIIESHLAGGLRSGAMLFSDIWISQR